MAGHIHFRHQHLPLGLFQDALSVVSEDIAGEGGLLPPGQVHLRLPAQGAGGGDGDGGDGQAHVNGQSAVEPAIPRHSLGRPAQRGPAGGSGERVDATPQLRGVGREDESGQGERRHGAEVPHPRRGQCRRDHGRHRGRAGDPAPDLIDRGPPPGQ